MVFTQRNFFLFFLYNNNNNSDDNNNLFNFERTTEEQGASGGPQRLLAWYILATYSSQNLPKCAFHYARKPMAVVQSIIYARPPEA